MITLFDFQQSDWKRIFWVRVDLHREGPDSCRKILHVLLITSLECSHCMVARTHAYRSPTYGTYVVVVFTFFREE